MSNFIEEWCNFVCTYNTTLAITLTEPAVTHVLKSLVSSEYTQHNSLAQTRNIKTISAF